jgi:putative membrane protein
MPSDSHLDRKNFGRTHYAAGAGAGTMELALVASLAHCFFFEEERMLIRWLLASLHLFALGIGLAAVWSRGRALSGPLDRADLQRALLADTFWGVAALLWIVTGLLRAFAGYEKGTEYYLQNDVFLLKMILLGLILVLEIWPMVTLIRWRIRLGRGKMPDTGPASAIARISWVQTILVILMVFAATAMARGYGIELW